MTAYPTVSDSDLLMMARVAVTRRLKGNCSAFARIAGVSDTLVQQLVNRGVPPIEARVRHQVYTTSMEIIEGKRRPRLANVREVEVRPTPALTRPTRLTPFANDPRMKALAEDFVRNNVLVGSAYSVRTKALYQRYLDWHAELVADNRFPGPALTAQRFGSFLRLVVPLALTTPSRGVDWGKEYQGVCLRPVTTAEEVPDSVIPPSARPWSEELLTVPPQLTAKVGNHEPVQFTNHTHITTLTPDPSLDHNMGGPAVPLVASPTWALTELSRLSDLALDLATQIEALKTRLEVTTS